MKGEALIYRPDGRQPERRDLTTSNPESLLPMLQTLVGGDIEAVPMWVSLPDGRACVAFCNEEGKLDELPFNPLATAAWYRAARQPMGDELVGTVVVVFGDEEFMEAL